MEIYTVEEFQERFDELVDKVQMGKHLGVIDEKGQAVVMMPVNDDLIRMYTDHDEAP